MTPAPGSASSALSSTAARSRLGSPKPCWTCSPSQTEPSSRARAGAAIGSSEHSWTLRPSATPSLSVSGAVAAATISRMAIRSHSPARPANGRATYVGTGPAALPWQALYLRPEPHGHGWRGPTSAVPSAGTPVGACAAAVRALTRDFLPMAHEPSQGRAGRRARPRRKELSEVEQGVHGGPRAGALAPPLQGEGLDDGHPAPGESGGGGVHLVGAGAAAAVGDAQVEAARLQDPGDVDLPVGEGRRVPDGVGHQLGDDDARVLDGLARPTVLVHPRLQALTRHRD